MVYMMGNNVLSCESILSIQQMAAVADPSNNYQFNIMWERSNVGFLCGNDTVLGVAPFTGCMAFNVQKTELKLIKNLNPANGNANGADPAILTDFIVQATASFPASHYVLIFYGNGGGLVYGEDDGYANTKTTTAAKTTAKKTTAKKTTAKKTTAKKTTATKTAKKDHC